MIAPGGIPVVPTNRGGQVTYHGPGQVVAYPLVDLRRLGIYVKEYVFRLEQALLKTLETYGVTGHRVRGEPGVYVRLDDPAGHAVLPPPDAAAPFAGLGKIAAIGVKVSRHRAYHGVALNVAMDLRPFERIHPCGHEQCIPERSRPERIPGGHRVEAARPVSGGDVESLGSVSLLCAAERSGSVGAPLRRRQRPAAPAGQTTSKSRQM